MSDSCHAKQQQIKTLFSSCRSKEATYQRIIELGREQTPLNPGDKIPANLVKGCQSSMYLTIQADNGVIIFKTEADALISAGLAQLLVRVYNGETAETILTCPPAYLKELGLDNALTPSRANGLYSIHLRMKQGALKHLTEQSQQHR